ncbi:MAG: HK97 family phage prohead protease [Nocardioides sp.]
MTKAARVVVKAVGPTDPAEKANDNGLGPGEFRALVSVFNNVDAYGDVVMPGAFTDVLADYAARGVPIPVLWSHQWADVFSHIGAADPSKATETDEGLEVVGALDVDSPIPEAAAVAQQVHRLMAQRRVGQFSFAFDVAEAGWGTRGEGDSEREVFELRKFSALHEVGPCLVGVNRDTRLDDVKALRAEYPRPTKADTPQPPGSPADPDPAQEPPTTTENPPGDAPGDDGETHAAKGLDPRSVALLADIAALG